MENVKEVKQKSGKEHIYALREVMHSVKILPKGVCGITSKNFGFTHLESAEIFLDAGVRMVKYLEEKESDSDEVATIRNLCHKHGALLIVNNHIDIAVKVKADCLSLWQCDTSISVAKEKFKGIIGASSANIGEAFKAQERGADYLEVGNLFSSTTDKRIVSFDEFRRIREKISLPIYAVGGIKLENIQMIKRLGAEGVMIRSAVLESPNPKRALNEILDVWNKT